MRAWLLLSLLAVAPAHAVELVRANASESAVRADGAVAFVERHGGEVRLAWRDAHGAVLAIATSGTPDTPAWSPSGDAIAYATMEGENSNLVVLDLASRRTRYVGATGDSEMHPFWSPDGNRLVYTRFVSNSGEEGELRLFEFDLRPGGADVPLLRGAPASYGSWSPDGQWLLYWHFVDGTNAEIAVSRGDGSEQRALTHDPAFDGWPSFSPDGRHAAFARERGEDADIRVVPFAGGEACLVAGGAGRKTSPKWSVDGRTIYFDRAFAGRTDLMRVDVPAQCLGGPEAGPVPGGDTTALPTDGYVANAALLARSLLVAPETGTQNWEPAIALQRDGGSAAADELLVAWMRARTQESRSATQVLLARSDGRSSATLVPLPSPTAADGLEFDPVVRAADGTAVVTAIGQPAQFGTQRTMWLARVRDGAPATPLVAIATGALDKQDVVEARLAPGAALLLADRTGLRTSFDAGTTLGPPVRPTAFVGLPQLVAMPPDRVGMVYYTNAVLDFVTTRNGTTLTAPVRVYSFRQPLGEVGAMVPGTFRVATIPAIARDPISGRLVVAVTDEANAGSSAYLLESRDDGASWRELAAPSRANGESHFFPVVAFDPAGQLHLAYAVARNGSFGAEVDIVHARPSNPDGLQWQKTTLTARPFDPERSIWVPFGGAGSSFIGDYLGIVASSTAAYVAHPAAGDDGSLQMAISRVGDALRARDLAGAWYEPATSGQGFDLSWIAPGRLLVFFYGHHDDGRNLFLVGTRDGDFSTGELLTIDLVETRGGRFNGLDANTIQRVPWGRVELNFLDCDRATARLVGLDGTSQLALVPLTRPAESACVTP